MNGLREVIDRFPAVRAAVVGDVVMDTWIGGPAQRLGREAAVPIVAVDEIEHAPGAAGNTAANVAGFGAGVRLFGVTGDDEAAADLRRALRERGVDDTDLVAVPGRRTGVKHRVTTQGQILARYDAEDRADIPGVAQRELVSRLAALRDARAEGAVDVIVVADYGMGVLTPAVREAVGALGAAGVPLVVDAHEPALWRPYAPAAVLPNFAEAAQLLGDCEPAGDRVRYLTRRSADLLAATGAATVVTTLDGSGTLVHVAGRRPYRTYAEPMPHAMSTGAGDTFTAAFALGLACGARPEAAAEIGQAAAAAVVRRPGTTTCTRHDLVRGLRMDDGPAVPAERLAARADEHRRRGHRIVFTNGCFDVLHRGHVVYLEQAAAIGDVLIVAVNADAGVARLKGPGRPVNPVEDRTAVLAALGCVDYVTVFEEDTPARLLDMIRPDVYVKGGDYTAQMLPETGLVERYGGEVRILDYVVDRSTTQIMDRIRSGAPAPPAPPSAPPSAPQAAPQAAPPTAPPAKSAS